MPQHGSTPLETPSAASQASTEEAMARTNRKLPGVLVVDDDQIVRIMVQLGLERSGFEVWTAANGRDAINLYQQHQDDIAVALLDVRMPNMDGPQTLDGLRALNPEIPACFMSGDTGGYDFDDLHQRAGQVIAKPFHLEQLISVLEVMVKEGSR
jgi:two-component system, OmpR family, response regulator